MDKRMNYAGMEVILKGDTTTTGGVVLEGVPGGCYSYCDIPIALKGHKVSCPACGQIGVIAEGIEFLRYEGVGTALDGYQVACGCPFGTHRLIAKQASGAVVTPQLSQPYSASFGAGARAAPAPAFSTSGYSGNTVTPGLAHPPSMVAAQNSANVVDPLLLPMQLPALIYQTKRQMDDYHATDMRHGDLDAETLKNRFDINVNSVSTKVNPRTLELIKQVDTYPFHSGYSLALNEPVKKATKTASAALMFDEFRQLAKLFSFHGEYQNIITEMIDHMQANEGKPYRSPLLDQALKEQILNDHSAHSTLLVIKDTLKASINFDCGFIPKTEESLFRTRIQERTILPKFNRWIDRTNGLVITVHDTYVTHITLESLVVQGDSYRARLHYRVQDHFGLDDNDVLNSLYRQFRIFRLWFTLQRWSEYGYKPFITEINAAVEITGRRDE